MAKKNETKNPEVVETTKSKKTETKNPEVVETTESKEAVETTEPSIEEKVKLIAERKMSLEEAGLSYESYILLYKKLWSANYKMRAKALFRK